MEQNNKDNLGLKITIAIVSILVGGTILTIGVIFAATFSMKKIMKTEAFQEAYEESLDEFENNQAEYEDDAAEIEGEIEESLDMLVGYGNSNDYDKKHVDMTDKCLFSSNDGKTTSGDSYWMFLDDETAKLVIDEDHYYIAKYTVIEGEAGMRYVEDEFPDYGLTFSELYLTTQSNMRQDEDCLGFVVIAFDDIEEYEDGEFISDEFESMFFYGTNYDKDNSIVYSLVGNNSGSYGYFIMYKDI